MWTPQELAYLKQKSRPQFEAAFREALATLTVRERTLLKLRYLDGVKGQQLAVLYRIDASNVSRALAAARDKLQEENPPAPDRRAGADRFAGERPRRAADQPPRPRPLDRPREAAAEVLIRALLFERAQDFPRPVSVDRGVENARLAAPKGNR